MPSEGADATRNPSSFTKVHPRATQKCEHFKPKRKPMTELTHIAEDGSAHMVDVSGKAQTLRRATARAFVRMLPETARRLKAADVPKGDVLGTARLAGIMGAKQTSTLIPLCHSLALDAVDVSFDVQADGVAIRSEACTTGRTGVEMEALTAASIAALTIYDMAKAIDRGMTIEGLQLVEKHGGKSGSWVRSDP